MDEMTKGEAAIAWGWLLEALAGFKEVGVSLLHDLIKMAPDLPEDLETKVNERVALRCLEDLFSPGDVPAPLPSTSTSTSTHHSKVTFDLSEGCDDVLQRIVNETPESDLKMGGPGLLKWDVQPFIVHKRASMPKCNLSQLKDSILDGTHPYADFLIKKSGLTSTRDGGNDRLPVSDSSRRRRFNGSCSNAKNMSVEGNDANVLLSKRDMIASNSENLADEDHGGVNGSDDLCRNVKKVKLDASYVSQSVEHNTISLPQKESLDDSSERDSPIFERERCVLAEYRMRMLEESEVLEDDHDNYTCSKRSGQSTEIAIHKSQLEIPCTAEGKEDSEHCPEPTTSGVVPPDVTQHKVPEHGSHVEVAHAASADGSQQKTVADRAKDPMDCHCESSDSYGFNNEKIDVAMKKQDFLTSQCTINRAYSDTIDWTEEKFCMKCNEGGQLLICSTTDCPLVYHEKCLGSEFICYKKGNFYCPFCSHSLALKEYLEAKKKAFLLRKDLDAFMCNVSEHQPAKFL
ncbi:PREDICTED: TRF 10 [Prunus dulcis]|uniref:PREDICTED: TRF 10 n=1 Tax=Prunus dulcis TaxID=3755 RepID=A0A5E4F165_PRUDU|nr:uncharacterized protein LOC117628682 [Prunus dulcis]KAI5330445.1 hypothetical protein L3X38_029843 [Prunus dulcis]VVA21496.1 PREDICTED: TRF 10 [Prunus dulcis]